MSLKQYTRKKNSIKILNISDVYLAKQVAKAVLTPQQPIKHISFT